MNGSDEHAAMNDWLAGLVAMVERAPRCADERAEEFAIVTVAQARGSTPREAGAKMIVSGDSAEGTIGGGRLEHVAIEIARTALADPSGPRASLRRFPLGADLGQCCGGVAVLLIERVAMDAAWIRDLAAARAGARPAVLVSATDSGAKIVVDADGAHGTLGDGAMDAAATVLAHEILARGDGARMHDVETPAAPGTLTHAARVLFEPVRRSGLNVVLFGAGHVGTALVGVLRTLPCDVTWIDGRADAFPDALPANVVARAGAAPDLEVDRAPPGSFYLVMTHSHPLDEAICERVLRRGDFRYLGLIGSTSKRRRFEKRLRARDVSAAALERLTCPIGIEGVDGKHPAEIAVAVAAELLRVRDAAIPAHEPRRETISEDTR